MFITMMADATAFSGLVFGYFFFWTIHNDFPPSGVGLNGPGVFWPMVALALTLTGWAATVGAREVHPVLPFNPVDAHGPLHSPGVRSRRGQPQHGRGRTSGAPVKKLAPLLALYFAQGLPFGFQTGALPLLLRERGVSLRDIGFAGALSAPWLMRAMVSGVDDPAVRADQVTLGAVFLWIFLPQVLVYDVGLVATAVLHARSRFALPAIAPAVNNVVVCAAYGLFALYFAQRLLRGGMPISVLAVVFLAALTASSIWAGLALVDGLRHWSDRLPTWVVPSFDIKSVTVAIHTAKSHTIK